SSWLFCASIGLPSVSLAGKCRQFSIAVSFRLRHDLDALRQQAVADDEAIAFDPLAYVFFQRTVVERRPVLAPEHQAAATRLQPGRRACSLAPGTEWPARHLAGEAFDTLRTVVVVVH